MKFSATVIGLAAVATAVAAQGPPAPPSETGSATETCKEGEAKGPDGSCSPAAPVQTSAPSNTTTPTTPTTPATPTPIYPNLVTPVTGASSVGHPLAVPTAGVPGVHPVLGYGGFGAYPGLPHPYAGYMPHPAVLAAAAQGPSNSTNGLPQAAAAHAAAFGAYPGAYPLPLAHPAFGAYPGAYPLAHPAFGGYPLAHPAFGGYPFAHPAVAAAHAAAFGAYPYAHPAVAAAHVAAAHAAAFGAYPFAHPAFGAYPYPAYQPYGVSYQVVGSQLPHPNFPWNHPALKAQVAANNVGINAANAAHQAAHQAVFGVPSPFAIPQYSHNYGAYGQAHPQQA